MMAGHDERKLSSCRQVATLRSAVRLEQEQQFLIAKKLCTTRACVHAPDSRAPASRR